MKAKEPGIVKRYLRKILEPFEGKKAEIWFCIFLFFTFIKFISYKPRSVSSDELLYAIEFFFIYFGRILFENIFQFWLLARIIKYIAAMGRKRYEN